MKLKLKITLTNEDGVEFMGIGLVWFLRAVDEHHSLHSAAEALNLSYVKALKILNRLEENVGYTVVERRRGGNDRGGAELTEAGRNLLEQYNMFQKKIKAYAEREYEQTEWSTN